MIDIATVLFLFIVQLYLYLVLSAPRYYRSRLVRVIAYRLQVQHRLAQLAQACYRIKEYVEKYSQVHSQRYLEHYSLLQTHYGAANKIHLQIVRHLGDWGHLVLTAPRYRELKQVRFAAAVTNTLFVEYGRFVVNDIFLKTKALPQVEKAKQDIVDLRLLPKKLSEEGQTLQQNSFDTIRKIIAEERAHDIRMDDIEQNMQDLEFYISELILLFSAHRRITIRQLDRAACQFDNIQKLVLKNEEILLQSQQQRVKLDERRVAVEGIFDSFSEQISPLRQTHPPFGILEEQTLALFEKVKAERKTRHFTQAHLNIELADNKMQLGMMISTLQPEITFLNAEKDYSFHTDPIEKTVDSFRTCVAETLQFDDSLLAQSLINRLNKLNREAVSLKNKHIQSISSLEKKQNRSWKLMEKYWDSLTNIAVLTEDPLTIKRSALIAQKQGVKGKPTLMYDLNEQVNSLVTVMKKASESVEEVHKKARKNVHELDQHAHLAQRWKTEWLCLTELATLIQNYHDDVKHQLETVSDSKTLANAYIHFDKIEDVYAEAQPIFQKSQGMYSQIIKHYEAAVQQMRTTSQFLKEAETMVSNWICLKGHWLNLSQLKGIKERELEQIGQIKQFDRVIAAFVALNNFKQINLTYDEICEQASRLDLDYKTAKEDLKRLQRTMRVVRANARKWPLLRPGLQQLKTAIKDFKKEQTRIKQIGRSNEVEASLQNFLANIESGWHLVHSLNQKNDQLNQFAAQAAIHVNTIKNVMDLSDQDNKSWKYLGSDKDEIVAGVGSYRKVLANMKRQESIAAVERMLNRLANTEEVALAYQQTTLIPHMTFKAQHQRYEQLATHWSLRVKEAEEKAREWVCLREDIGQMVDMAKHLRSASKQIKGFGHKKQVEITISSVNQDIHSGNETYERFSKDYARLVDKLALIHRYFGAIEQEDWGSHSRSVRKKTRQLREMVKDAQNKAATADEALNILSSVQRSAEGIFTQFLSEPQILKISRVYGLNLGDHGQVNQHFPDQPYAT